MNFEELSGILICTMNLTPRIDEAIKLAARLHRTQVRNDHEQTPYISHLVSVMYILAQVSDDEDVLIAGLMHDALEDVPGYTYESLVRDCGSRVAEIVKHVTEPLDATKDFSEQMPWLERKEAYIRALTTGGKESALVSAADKIHNTESILRDMNRDDGLPSSKFHSSLRNRLWFHEQVLIIIKEKLGDEHMLVKRLSTCTESFKALVASREGV